MLASYTPPGFPLLVSIWGNDLTLHAPASRKMRKLTRRTLQHADGLIADSHRDIRLARQLGYAFEKPTLVVPGNGGIDLTQFQQGQIELPQPLANLIPAGSSLVVNPRGLRSYVRNDVFFQAIPLVLKRNPDVHFICPSMAGQPEALRWVERLKLHQHVTLLTMLPQHILWGLFSQCAVTVSITTHDGTPNTLLETMTSGCFPIAGDIEALREWITPGVNGLLVDPSSPQALAEAILLALDQPQLRSRAAEINLNQIRQRAEVNMVRAQVEVYYQRFSKQIAFEDSEE
jgi:glycosyltransferase involved in cell wall biosynthesis